MIHLIKERMEAGVRKNLKLGDILNINVRSGALKECEVIGIYPHIVAVRYLDSTKKRWLTESFQLFDLYKLNIGGVRN